MSQPALPRGFGGGAPVFVAPGAEMDRRGFSVIELLVVLGVLVAVGAVVTADLAGRTADARLAEASRRVESAFVLARAEAQRAGRAMNLLARAEGRTARLVLAAFDADGESIDGSGDGGRAAPRATPPPSERLLVVLPAGVLVTSGEASSAGGAGLDAASGRPTEPRPGDDAGAASVAGASEPVRLAVMLPDGTCRAEPSCRLVGPGPRRAGVTVSRWTGRARVAPIADEAATEAGASPSRERPPKPEPLSGGGGR